MNCRRRFGIMLAGASLVALPGCGEGSGPVGDVATVVLSPANRSLPVGAVQQYTATARDADGQAIPGKQFTWASSGTAAIMSETGLVTAIAVGASTISATVDGVAGSTGLTVLPPSGQTLAVVGGQLQRGPVGEPLPVAYLVEAREGTTPLAGVDVFWSVIGGGGSVTTGTTQTGLDGRAVVIHTLGGAPGSHQVLARAPGLSPADTSLRHVVFEATGLPAGDIVPLVTVPIPPNYGIHDTFVREGMAFVFAWDSGVRIFDVGHGVRGGSPSNPVMVSRVLTQGGQAHNGWWFHNPNTAEKKYLFVGEEGPGIVGSASSGNIHVIDVSDFAAPVEVAFFTMPGAGTHNFWMDEPNEILYAAYYNGGIVALDVSGTLTGDLSARLIDQITPATGAYVWGVQLANGFLYASDMVHGLWQLSTSAGAMAVAAGGNNVAERFTSDLWVHGGYAYTGTWGGFPRMGVTGNALKVWQLSAGGVPALVDSIITPNISTVSDVEVSADGSILMISTETGSNDGFRFFSLADPAHPVFLAQFPVSTGIHTATFGYIGGRVFAFGAKNPGSPELVVLDVTDVGP